MYCCCPSILDPIFHPNLIFVHQLFLSSFLALYYPELCSSPDMRNREFPRNSWGITLNSQSLWGTFGESYSSFFRRRTVFQWNREFSFMFLIIHFIKYYVSIFCTLLVNQFNRKMCDAKVLDDIFLLGALKTIWSFFLIMYTRDFILCTTCACYTRIIITLWDWVNLV